MLQCVLCVLNFCFFAVSVMSILYLDEAAFFSHCVLSDDRWLVIVTCELLSIVVFRSQRMVDICLLRNQLVGKEMICVSDV